MLWYTKGLTSVHVPDVVGIVVPIPFFWDVNCVTSSRHSFVLRFWNVYMCDAPVQSMSNATDVLLTWVNISFKCKPEIVTRCWSGSTPSRMTFSVFTFSLCAFHMFDILQFLYVNSAMPKQFLTTKKCQSHFLTTKQCQNIFLRTRQCESNLLTFRFFWYLTFLTGNQALEARGTQGAGSSGNPGSGRPVPAHRVL